MAKSFSDDPAVYLFTLQSNDVRVTITNVGATVTSLTVPDNQGLARDIVLGFDTGTPYLDGTSPYFGCIVGRVANRIGNAQFTLEGQTYQLTPNDSGKHTLHGGTRGLDKHVWQVDGFKAADKGKAAEGEKPEDMLLEELTLSTTSEDGDQGFPGSLRVTVTYSVEEPSTLSVRMRARVEGKATPVSLAHHMYWNLGGHDSGDVLSHNLRINASRYTPVSEDLIATGELPEIAGTPFDFHSQAKPIGQDMSSVPGGFDHNFVLRGTASWEGEGGGETVTQTPPPPLSLVAESSHPSTGIKLEVRADAPGVQFYTGNFLDGSFEGKQGVRYGKHAGFCFETQAFPNAVNEPKFPPIVLQPGEEYSHNMLFRFSVSH